MRVTLLRCYGLSCCPRAAGSPEQELRLMVSVRFVRVFAPRAAGSPEQELRHLDQVDHERSAGAPRAAGSPEQELRRRHDQLSLEAVGEPRAAGSPEQELRRTRSRRARPSSATPSRRFTRTGIETADLPATMTALAQAPSRRFTRTGIETRRPRRRRAASRAPEPQVHQNRN